MTNKEILKIFKDAISYQEEWGGCISGNPDGEYEEFLKELKKAKKAYKELKEILKEK